MVKKWGISRLLVLCFTIASLALSAGCAPTDRRTADSSIIPPDQNILRVGVSTNSPPLIFKQNNKIVGLEADFAQVFAEHLGKTLRFVELEWDDQIAALLENRIDIIMSGMSITALREVRVAFPKFKLETRYQVKDYLMDMGMVTPFTYDADFSGMTGSDELFIEKVIHQAVVEVNEEGSEAAAATSVHMVLKAVPDYVSFDADHPFIFFIQHKETGTILFMGKILNPLEE